jgi:hypothetical protein
MAANDRSGITRKQWGEIMIKFAACAITLLLALAPAAFTQQANSQGMHMQGHSMGNMDMQAMMNRCAQMRQQMRPGARMTSDMQRMMMQCNQMDQQMGAMPGSSGSQERTR